MRAYSAATLNLPCLSNSKHLCYYNEQFLIYIKVISMKIWKRKAYITDEDTDCISFKLDAKLVLDYHDKECLVSCIDFLSNLEIYKKNNNKKQWEEVLQLSVRASHVGHNACKSGLYSRLKTTIFYFYSTEWGSFFQLFLLSLLLLSTYHKSK